MNYQALHEYMARVAGLPHRLGVYDCVMFVAESLQVGWDREYIGDGWLGYWDRRTAVNRLRAGGGLMACVTECLGEPVSIANGDLKVEDGCVIWIPQPDTLGLLVTPSLVLAKAHKRIDRIAVHPQMIGWSTK